MKYAYSRYSESIEKELLEWLRADINIAELKKSKTLEEIISDYISPNLPKFLIDLDYPEFLVLIRMNIVDLQGMLLPKGKGYLAGLVSSIS